MQSLDFHKYLTPKDKHRPLFFNAVLWSLIFISLLIIFTKGESPIKVDLAYTLVYTLFMTLPVTINFYVLMPRFLKRERYLEYSILMLLCWLSCSILVDWSLGSVLDFLYPEFFFISYPKGINYYVITCIILVASSLLKLAEDWFHFNKKEQKLLQLKNVQAETQLLALRAQINPHFLFNSLNVLYALALEKSDALTSSIIQLSEILRYVLYDTNVERVTIEKEVELIKNYVKFQKARHGMVHDVNLSLDLKNTSLKIYPMLLLPLVENAFKHGLKDKRGIVGAIEIEMRQKDNTFLFAISNPKGNSSISTNSESSGIGIENIKSNLNIVYPNSHEFKIEESNNNFSIFIKIKDLHE